jgi:radical SAM-linked protein
VCFVPERDFETQLRERGLPLFGLRSRSPLSRFDVLVALLRTPLDLPDLLNLLERGAVPVRARERGPHDPIVFVAGEAALTPACLWSAADGCLPGDPEAFVGDLVTWMEDGAEQGWERATRLFRASEHDGFMVHEAKSPTRKTADTPALAVARWLAALPPVPPDGLFPHGARGDEVAVEVSRPRGIEAGPDASHRFRPLEVAVQECEALVAATGCGGIVLSGASRYPHLIPLLEALNQKLSAHRVTVRPQSLDLSLLRPSLARELNKGRRAELTLAPMEVSARLREAAGRPFTREDWVEAAATALKGGWKGMRFRAVLGSPGETEADRRECLEVLEEVSGLRGRKTHHPRLTLEVVPFVPPPGTRWEGDAPVDPELFEKTVDAWRERLQRHRIKVEAGSPHRAAVLAAMMRGDAGWGEAAEAVARAGGRRQGEEEGFSRELWESGRASALPAREDVPWFRVVSDETAAAPAVRSRPVLRDGFGIPAWSSGRRPKRSARGKERKAERFRLRFAKDERLRFVSHLDVTRAFSRAFRMSQLPVAVSNGKERRLRVAFGPPLPLGMTSDAEYLDITFVREVPESFVKSMNECLPEGLVVAGCAPIRTEAASLNSAIEIAGYEVSFSDTVITDFMGGITFDELKARLETRINGILASERFEVTRIRGEEKRTFNARPSLKRANVVRDDGGRPVVELTLTMNQPQSARPELVTTTLVDWTEVDERLLRVHRRGLFIPGREKDLDPLDVVVSGFAWWRQPVRGGTVL